MTPRNLTCTVRYTFQDGSTQDFTGKKCYRLSNSWRDACDKAQRACQTRGETFDLNRTASPN